MLGQLPGVEFDAHRHALHHLDPVAGGVLRRQQRERGTGARADTGHAAVVLDLAAIEVGTQLHALADAHLAQLHLLEIGLDPDLVERNHRHQRRAGGDALAHLHGAPGHLPGHRRGDLGALHGEKGLAHRGRGAFDVGVLLDGGAVGQGAVAGGLLLSRGQRRARTHQRTGGRRQCGFGVQHLLAGDRAALHQRAAAVHIVGGARHVGLHARHFGLTQLNRRVQRRVVGVQRAHLAHGLRELRFGALERELRVGGVQPHQRLAGLDPIGVIGQHGQHGAGDLRRDLHHRRLHVGVVGRFEVPLKQRPVRAVAEPREQHEAGDREHGRLTPPLRASARG